MTKYRLIRRRGTTGGADLDINHGDRGVVIPVGDEVADLLRSHPDVTDETVPDWSDVKPGTAGMATVRGWPGQRVFRLKGEQWQSLDLVAGTKLHDDEHVTDFQADVAVSLARVDRAIGLITSTTQEIGPDSLADQVQAILWGES